MAVTLRRVPSAPDALSARLPARAVRSHHRDRQADRLKARIAGNACDTRPVANVAAEGRASGDTDILENAVEIIKHDSYWQSMTPGRSALDGGAATARLVEHRQAA